MRCCTDLQGRKIVVIALVGEHWWSALSNLGTEPVPFEEFGPGEGLPRLSLHELVQDGHVVPPREAEVEEFCGSRLGKQAFERESDRVTCNGSPCSLCYSRNLGLGILIGCTSLSAIGSDDTATTET